METKNLAEALAKAQAKIKAPIKNRHVDFTPKSGGRVKYSYADLADVIEAVRVPLSENNLCIVHRLKFTDSGYCLETSLLHSSGESIHSLYPLPDPGKQQIRAQEFGSALTYARRYSLSSLIGIASEEDDDGASAAPTLTPTKRTPPPPPKPNPHLSTNPPKSPHPEPEPEPMPDYEHELFDADPMSQLLQFQKSHGITNEQISDAIFRTTGNKTSKECSDLDLINVLNYLKMKL